MALGVLGLLDTYAIPRQTQTAGTVIAACVPPRKWRRTKISFLQYTSGATAHTITFLGELGRTTLTAAAAGGATSFTLARDPGNYSAAPEFSGRGITPSTANNLLAASDYFVVQLADGTWYMATVSSVSTNADGTVTVTVSAIPSAGIAKGATYFHMGVAGDTDPHRNAANPQLKPGTSATTVYPNASGAGGSVIFQSHHPESPVIVYSDNPTAAGTLDYGSAVYGQ